MVSGGGGRVNARGGERVAISQDGRVIASRVGGVVSWWQNC